MTSRSIAPIPLITALVLCLAAIVEVTFLARQLLSMTFLATFSCLVTIVAYIFFAVVLFVGRRDILLAVASAGLSVAALITLAVNSPNIWHVFANLCFLLAALVLTAWAACPFLEPLRKHQPVTESLWFLPGILAFVAALLATMGFMHIGGLLGNIMVIAQYFLLGLNVVFPDGNPMREPTDPAAAVTPAPDGIEIPPDPSQPQADLPLYRPVVWDGRCEMLNHILLLLFTFGVWYFVWVYRATGFLNGTRSFSDRNPTNQLILCIFVPFYLIYWVYQSARRIDIQAADRGIPSELSTLCLVMALFAPVLPPILMQDKLNRFSESSQPKPGPFQDGTAQDLAACLRTYKQLQEDGLITPEDYEAKKKQLLNL